MMTAESVFARVFAAVFTTIGAWRLSTSIPVLRALRDGTDPLIGGHRAALGLRLSVIGIGLRQGGAP